MAAFFNGNLDKTRYSAIITEEPIIKETLLGRWLGGW